MSTFVQNYYVAIVGPFVLSYIVGRLCYAFLPDVCNPNNYMQAYLFSLVANDDQWIICARSLLLFGTLSIIIGIAFVWRIERKIPNEI